MSAQRARSRAASASSRTRTSTEAAPTGGAAPRGVAGGAARICRGPACAVAAAHHERVEGARVHHSLRQLGVAALRSAHLHSAGLVQLPCGRERIETNDGQGRTGRRRPIGAPCGGAGLPTTMQCPRANSQPKFNGALVSVHPKKGIRNF